MTTLPIDPNYWQIVEWLQATAAETRGTQTALVYAAFLEGIEAERARAAAETTEAEIRTEWGIHTKGAMWDDVDYYGTHEDQARSDFHSDPAWVELVSRAVTYGPWEVQS
jgi:hypothetical protein